MQKLAGAKMPNDDAHKAVTSLHAMMKEAVSPKLNLNKSALSKNFFYFQYLLWVGGGTKHYF